MANMITPEIQSLVETELRKGASNSRIANLLGLPYNEAVEMIEEIKESFRPEVGDEILFSFRGEKMRGVIEKLLTNSAVVLIKWNESSEKMHDLVEEKTIVNFKDIEEYVTNSNEPTNEVSEQT
ncbi:DUF2187 family protein [Lacticigenium naphthae]|uniref:DUF2187 family protein n=1 Tax=Lacticigenium naphthae TaxID=515351 RepID=UPI0003FB8AE6|nr:DUF2187 family protein [Lacticigenium naphthae]